MKRILFSLLLLAPFFASAQSGSINAAAVRSRVTDSTTVATPTGYGVIYYNAQSNKFRVYQNGAWSDLTGGSGGGGGGISPSDNVTWTGTASWRDNNFSLYDNSDLTKIGKFELSGITTATTRTLTWPNASGTIALTSDIPSLSTYVVGPASAVNNRVAFFDGTTGKLIKDSGLTLSGSNTGDQTITLTGELTGSGTGSFATTLAKSAITNRTAVTPASGDYVLISDVSDSDNLKKVTVGSLSGGSMVYPGAGIPLSTGSAWGTSITNNSANWNTAYGWGDHGYVTPEDYGAVGDGVTNDASAIQSAVNSGKTVYFGNKTYLVSTSVTVPVNAHLKGSGSLSIIKTTSNIHLFEIDSINTTFENLTFLGNDTGTSQVGISAEGNSTITLHRYGNSVINCRFYDFGGSGLYGKNVMGAGSSSHRGGFYVTNSTFTSNRYGIHWDTQMEYNNVVNSTMTANTVGIYMGAAGNNSFSACNINDNTTGFQVVGGANDAHCVMDGSKLNHNTTAININGVGFGYLFSDCMIYSNPITIVNSTRIKFLGCDISTTSITSTSNTQLQFTNNRFYQTPTFTVTGSNPLFFNNTWDSGTLPSILNNTIVGLTTFTPTATNAGLDVGSVASDPSSLSNGKLWYNSTSNELKAYINGGTVALGGGGGGGTVTSVGMTVPSFLSVSGSPVTSSGTLAVSWNGGTGVNTWMSTPSWTNLLSATTGTVPFWSLASGGTATAANTFTANSPNYLTYTGTWTGTTDGDAHRIYSGSITGSGTVGNSFYADRYMPTLTAGANNQVLYGTYIVPTFATGGFTGVNPIALYVKGSTTVPGTSMILVGGGTNSASYNALQTLDNAGSTLFSVRTDATVTHSATAWAFTNTAFSTNSSSANQYLISHNRTPDDGGYAHNIRSSATISSTSGARGRAQVLGGTFSPSSGTATETTFRVRETFNQTSTASGVITSLLIDPTVTSVTGSLMGIDYNPSSNPTTHLAFRATSGDVLIGSTSITSNTKFDIRGKGGAVTNNVLRLATSSNTEVFNFKENGHFNAGSYNERGLTGTSSGTSFSETIFASTEISDGESVTIEVLWTVKDADTNTGAGGIFYTTWTKASGTLAKAGDNQLVTNNNTGDTFTVSTSDSSGNISLTISSTGSSGNWKGNGFVKLIKKS